MRPIVRRAFVGIVAIMALTMSSVVLSSGPAAAVDVGELAPDFKLPSTTGTDVSLADFRGITWVLLEFYGADFVPT
jgi:hypothetical protein